MSGKKRSLPSTMNNTDTYPSPQTPRLNIDRANQGNNNETEKVTIKCSECDKQGRMKAETYDAKSDTDDWFFMKHEEGDDYDLLCMECLSGYDSSSESSSCMPSNFLKECEIIKKWDVPDVIVKNIKNFAFAPIVLCIYCKKEGWMDCDKFYEGEDTKKWKFSRNWGRYISNDNYMLCEKCWEKYICTLCEESATENNYYCETCEETVCPECDEEKHINLHRDNGIILPGWEAYFDDNDCT